MYLVGLVTGGGLVLGGGASVALVATGPLRHRRRGGDLVTYLDDAEATLSEPLDLAAGLPDGHGVGGGRPFAERVLRPLGRGLAARIRAFYPNSHLDRLHRQLLHGGLSATMTAEEMATLQVAVVGLAAVLGLAVVAGGHGSLRLRLLGAAIICFCGALGPQAWLSRKVGLRTSALERDLPDVLDLLTIAVESGLGLEQAMDAACHDLDSPMTEEMGRTLQEMSLGLSRHAALENLRSRSASSDLSSFVVVLTQADALGMPIGRVLRSQADEARDRRRARAREQAAKLPVKILFPLLFFILPVLIIIVMGPAAAAIARAFHL